jgi:hypothetical protein
MRLVFVIPTFLSLSVLGADTVSFNRDIQPILSENCYHCHGPDSAARKANMRLDRPEFAFQKAKSGDVVIIKGSPETSPLIKRVTTTDQDDVMPPPETHKSLKPSEVALLKQWIKEGAKYQEHWAFIAPIRPAPPQDGTQWSTSPIDQFVVARLAEQGLKPSPTEDRARLFRRLSLDLTGLPPTPEDVKAFLADTSPQAYEKAVEKMLTTNEHAEQMARHWLDAVRYADTHGIHIDNARNIYPYRDWVIQAFKKNMPFDQFTIEQVGGDLLPKATVEQIVATGYCRCLPTTGEGGAIPEEVMANYAKDQVETMGAVWLGLTLGCAACHDHKFDPVTTKEFYQLSAFFRNTPMYPLDGNNANHPPSMLVLPPEQRGKQVDLEMELAALQAEDAARKAKADKAFAAWRVATSPDAIQKPVLPAAWTFDAEKPQMMKSPKGSNVALKTIGTPTNAKRYNGFILDGRSAYETAEVGDFEINQGFSVRLLLTMTKGSDGAIVARMDESHDFRGWDVWLQGGRPAMHLISHWQDKALKVVSKTALPLNKEVELIVIYDGSGKADGIKFYLDGDLLPAAPEVNAPFTEKESLRTTVPFRIGTRSNASGAAGIAVREVAIYPVTVPSADVATLGKVDELRQALGKEGMKAKAPTVALLRNYYDQKVDTSDKSVLQKIKAVNGQLDALKAKGAMTLVMKENSTPPTAKILKRGQYLDAGEMVYTGTPQVLPPLKKQGQYANRLDLAKWLVQRDNPLTARVTMNRLWYQFFGTGLSETTENLGIMGEKPQNQALLDWLAVEFMDSKWDLRHMVRLIVNSKTYQQSGAFTPEKLEKDPRNRLLSRGPRYRVDAEIVRDSALAVSGLLVHKVGGPSVRPYQPENIWSDVAMKESNTRFYTQDKGENLYRRSMYTFLKRSAPPPMMLNFDATSREVFCTRRDRSNSPLQALNLINDVEFIEPCRVLAEKLLTEEKTDEARIDRLSWLYLSRPASDAEKKILLKAVQTFRQDYASQPDEAAKLAKYGEWPVNAKLPATEVAAWTLVASEMLNRDETLNK